jgi:hypothetical protein
VSEFKKGIFRSGREYLFWRFFFQINKIAIRLVMTYERTGTSAKESFQKNNFNCFAHLKRSNTFISVSATIAGTKEITNNLDNTIFRTVLIFEDFFKPL